MNLNEKHSLEGNQDNEKNNPDFLMNKIKDLTIKQRNNII